MTSSSSAATPWSTTQTEVPQVEELSGLNCVSDRIRQFSNQCDIYKNGMGIVRKNTDFHSMKLTFLWGKELLEGGGRGGVTVF